METISVLEYLKRTGLLEDIAETWNCIPNTIEYLLKYLDDEERNYWSFDLQDVASGAVELDPEKTVLVEDFYSVRYFELEETETW